MLIVYIGIGISPFVKGVLLEAVIPA